MPQEDALIDELKISEILNLFAQLHQMAPMLFKNQLLKIGKFLEPLPMDALISTLSGGEKRKLSFAISMIHRPKFLILDEPSVCLDPVIRHDMWNALIETSQNDETSVLITTHYYHEAKNAHKVGYMESGAILFEDTPTNICQRALTEMIDEGIFYAYKNPQEFQYKKTCDNPQDGADEVEKFSNRNFSFQALWGLINMEMCVFKRKYGVVFYFLLMHVIFVVCYVMTFQKMPGDISMGIFKHDDFNCGDFDYDAKCEFEGELEN